MERRGLLERLELTGRHRICILPMQIMRLVPVDFLLQTALTNCILVSIQIILLWIARIRQSIPGRKLKEIKEKPVTRGQKGKLVIPDLKDLKDLKGLKDLKAKKETKEIKGIQVMPERMVWEFRAWMLCITSPHQPHRWPEGPGRPMLRDGWMASMSGQKQ